MARGRMTGKRECSERKQKGEGGNDRVFFYVSCIFYKIHYFCGSKSADKIQKILAKYINCPSLDVTKYNTKTKEGMIQLVDDYTKTCK
ncbi:hypothetical protein HMPREF9078_01864 [Capnocytophaga sp. oral taxon 380 str. F0488]|jgi:hypothetical protein|nr:hypothetical protein HMPREF9078_01864 [Capnocytophaga sp. oral taxon 380 str. F0488]